MLQGEGAGLLLVGVPVAGEADRDFPQAEAGGAGGVDGGPVQLGIDGADVAAERGGSVVLGGRRRHPIHIGRVRGRGRRGRGVRLGHAQLVGALDGMAPGFGQVDGHAEGGHGDSDGNEGGQVGDGEFGEQAVQRLVVGWARGVEIQGACQMEADGGWAELTLRTGFRLWSARLFQRQL